MFFFGGGTSFKLQCLKFSHSFPGCKATFICIHSLMRPCKTEPLFESQSVAKNFAQLFEKLLALSMVCGRSQETQLSESQKELQYVILFCLSIGFKSKKNNQLLPFFAKVNFGLSTLTPQKGASHIVWQLWGYVLGSWGLWLYEGGVWICIFQQHVFGMRPWVTKTNLTGQGKEQTSWFRAHFLLKTVEKCNFWQQPCGAVVLAINLIFLLSNKLEKLHQVVIDLARGLEYFDDIELIHGLWWGSSLFEIHKTFKNQWQTPDTCVQQLLPVCLGFLFAYWRCNKLDPHRLLLSLFCLKKYQFWFLLMLSISAAQVPKKKKNAQKRKLLSLQGSYKGD